MKGDAKATKLASPTPTNILQMTKNQNAAQQDCCRDNQDQGLSQQAVEIDLEQLTSPLCLLICCWLIPRSRTKLSS